MHKRTISKGVPFKERAAAVQCILDAGFTETPFRKCTRVLSGGKRDFGLSGKILLRDIPLKIHNNAYAFDFLNRSSL